MARLSIAALLTILAFASGAKLEKKLVTVFPTLKPLRDPPPGPRIVGGTEVVPHSYPWQVHLLIDGAIFCGGSVIDQEWVMTAAHCANGRTNIKITMGDHDRLSIDGNEVVADADQIIVHENWQPLLIHNDIAVLHMPAQTFSQYVDKVGLPSKTAIDLPAGTIVTPTGWGLFSDSLNILSDYLREVDVPVMSSADCQSYYGSTINENIICTDGAGGKGTCSGDSGGPLNYNDNGRATTRGIVSFGSSAGCEKGYPDGFTRVKNYLDWIETNTGVTF